MRQVQARQPVAFQRLAQAFTREWPAEIFPVAVSEYVTRVGVPASTTRVRPASSPSSRRRCEAAGRQPRHGLASSPKRIGARQCADDAPVQRLPISSIGLVELRQTSVQARSRQRASAVTSGSYGS